VEAHRYDDARRYSDQAIEAKRAENDTTGVFRSRILNARIDRETNRLDEASRTLEDVIAHSDSHFILFEARAELARVAAARKDAANTELNFRQALSTIDEARAGLDNELRLAFANVSVSLYRDYVEFLVASGRPRDALLVAELSRARTLVEGLGVQRERTGMIEPEAIARKANVTVLSYWLAPARSFLFVVTPNGVQQFTLPAADTIIAAVDAYQKDLGNRRRGSELYTMLVAPAAAAIHGNRITVIPDGHLAAFNLETLLTPKGRYWIEDVTLESANALQFVDATKRSEHGNLLLIGNAVQADPQFPRLPHAGEEIASIEKYFDRHTTLAGAAATPAAYLKSKPESFAYVHFVAHAAATRQRPLDSAVILGGGPTGYKLYARDVVTHLPPLKARLVTISSCHGAGKRAFAGEGLVGLAWAFLRAGAHEVVAALWEVNDASTVRLMNAMYRGIHDGQPPADALRAAKLDLLRSNTPYRAPRYWAPFVLYSGS
jgi:predicted nucleic acid-binding protein